MAGKKRTKTLGLLVLLGGLVGAGLYFRASGSGAAAATVWVVSPQTQSLDLTVSAPGNAIVATQRSVGFSTAGRLDALTVEVGAPVKAGEVLARLDDRTARLSIETAKATVAQAKARALAARQQRTPQERVRDARLVEQARAALESAQRAEEATKRSTGANADQLAEARERAERQRDRDAELLVDAQLRLDEAIARFANARTERDAASAARDAMIQEREAAISARDSARAEADALIVRVTAAQSELIRVQGEQAATQLRTQRAIDDAQAAYDRARLEADSLRVAAGDNGVVVALPSSAALDLARRSGADALAVAQDGVNRATTALGVEQKSRDEATKRADQALRAAEEVQRRFDETTTRLERARTEFATAEGLDREVRAQVRQTNDAAKRSADLADATAVDLAAGRTKDAQTAEQALATKRTAEAQRRLQEALVAVSGQGPRPADIAAADAAVKAAEVTVAQAERDLDLLVLRSPIDATVVAVNSRVGEQVAPTGTGGASLIVLSSTDDLLVRVGFAEADSVRVKVGQPATVSFDSLRASAVSGKVERIDPTATVVNNVVTYYVRIRLGRIPEGVRPGLTGLARVQVGTRSKALTVPAVALSQRDGATLITTWSPKGPEEVEVVIGERSNGAVEITSGITEGALLIVPEGTEGAEDAAALSTPSTIEVKP